MKHLFLIILLLSVVGCSSVKRDLVESRLENDYHRLNRVDENLNSINEQSNVRDEDLDTIRGTYDDISEKIRELEHTLKLLDYRLQGIVFDTNTSTLVWDEYTNYIPKRYWRGKDTVTECYRSKKTEELRCERY